MKHADAATLKRAEARNNADETISHSATLRERFAAMGASVQGIADDLHIETGTIADYHALSAFHYRAAHPGAATSVFRMMHRAPTVVGRYLGRGDASQIVGVLVVSMPALACGLRDLATRGRYRGLPRREAAIMINREVRTISRVVIDPQWRGLGLAVRLVRHALQHPHEDICFTEALAAMGRVSPFFERAGMTRYDRPIRAARAEHARLLDALDRLGWSPAILASWRVIAQKLSEVTSADHRWLESELRRWHRAAHRSAASATKSISVEQLLRIARRELLAQPVYYLYAHPYTQTETCPLEDSSR